MRCRRPSSRRARSAGTIPRQATTSGETPSRHLSPPARYRRHRRMRSGSWIRRGIAASAHRFARTRIAAASRQPTTSSRQTRFERVIGAPEKGGSIVPPPEAFFFRGRIGGSDGPCAGNPTAATRPGTDGRRSDGGTRQSPGVRRKTASAALRAPAGRARSAVASFR